MTGRAATPRRLTLPPEPRSVGRARQAVRESLAERDAVAGLRDEATLLVSEVVTNAVLHAATPIEVSCAVEDGTVCVEVRDRSPVLPGRRRYHDDAMTGRGLALLQRVSAAWGVEADPTGQGKVVWFQLAAPGAQAPPRPRPDLEEAPRGERFVLRLRRAPAALIDTTVQYGDSLLRELTLAALADDDGGWSAHGSRVDLAPVLDAVHRAARDGAAAAREWVDVDVALPAAAGLAAFERLALTEEADRMAHDGALLTIPELPEVAACRRWFLREIGVQAAGAAPTPWQLPGPLESVRQAPALPPGERAWIDGLGSAAIVADDGNRIVHVNPEAARLLGWPVEDLTGRRLVSIVPHRLREAHLAGFGRFLLTREPRLLGQRVVLPALRRDGTEVDVALIISLLDRGEGTLAFLARLTEASAPTEPGGPMPGDAQPREPGASEGDAAGRSAAEKAADQLPSRAPHEDARWRSRGRW